MQATVVWKKLKVNETLWYVLTTFLTCLTKYVYWLVFFLKRINLQPFQPFWKLKWESFFVLSQHFSDLVWTQLHVPTQKTELVHKPVTKSPSIQVLLYRTWWFQYGRNHWYSILLIYLFQSLMTYYHFSSCYAITFFHERYCQSYCLAHLSVSTRHSLTSTRACIMPERQTYM